MAGAHQEPDDEETTVTTPDPTPNPTPDAWDASRSPLPPALPPAQPPGGSWPGTGPTEAGAPRSGAAPAPARRSRTRVVALAGGLVAAAVLLGGGAAVARGLADEPAGAPTVVAGRSGDGDAQGADRLAGPGAAGPGGPGAGPGRSGVTGTVGAVDDDGITVELADGSTSEFALDASTQVVLDGEPAAVVDLTTGETVLVHADPVDGTGTLVAELVVAGDPPAGQGGPGGGPGGGGPGVPPGREGEEVPDPSTQDV